MSERRLHRHFLLQLIFGLFPAWTFFVTLVRPRNLKNCGIPCGENRVRSYHISGCHGFSLPGWGHPKDIPEHSSLSWFLLLVFSGPHSLLSVHGRMLHSFPLYSWLLSAARFFHSHIHLAITGECSTHSLHHANAFTQSRKYGPTSSGWRLQILGILFLLSPMKGDWELLRAISGHYFPNMPSTPLPLFRRIKTD